MLLRITLMGQFGVWDGTTRLEVPGGHATRVLAVLAAEIGRVVSVSALVDEVWGPDAPDTAAHQVRKTCSALRSSLPAGRSLIRTSGSGYVLERTGVEVDIEEFNELLARARAIRDSGGGEFVDLLERAIAMWQPITVGADTLRGVSTALHSSYLSAVAMWARVRLERGEETDLIPELQRLVAKEPYSEELREILMVALYRVGRGAAALEEYQAARAVLAEELGVDPGPGLQQTQAAILEGSPSLLARGHDRGRDGQEAQLTPPPDTLPRTASIFVGRPEEQDQLVSLVEDPDSGGLVVVTGMAGIGKTSTVVRAVRACRRDYPGGLLYVDLGVSRRADPMDAADDAAEQLLLALGVPGAVIPRGGPARWDAARSRLSAQDTLVILDNVTVAEQVHALASAGAGSTTIAVSRSRLSELEDATEVVISPLTIDESISLMTAVLGVNRVRQEPDAARELASYCGGIPLALRVAVGQMRRHEDLSLSEVAMSLRSERERLERLRFGRRSMEAALRSSFSSLEPELRTALADIVSLPRSEPVCRDCFSAWTGQDLDLSSRLLDNLCEASFATRQRAHVYSVHDLVRLLVAGERGQPDADQDARFERLTQHLLRESARAADQVVPRHAGEPGQADQEQATAARRWLQAHVNVLQHLILDAPESTGTDRLLELSGNLSAHLLESGRHELALTISRAASAQARLSQDPRARVITMVNEAVFDWRLGSQRAAVARMEEALELVRSHGAQDLRPLVLSRLGAFRVDMGEVAGGVAVLREALAILPDTLVRERASALNSLAVGLLRDDDRPGAERALGLVLDLDAGPVENGLAKFHAATAALIELDLDRSESQLHGSLRDYRSIGSGERVRLVHALLALVLTLRGRTEQAAEALAEADQARSAGSAWDVQVELLLAIVEVTQGRLDRARQRHTLAVRAAARMDNSLLTAELLDVEAALLSAAGQEDAAAEMFADADDRFAQTGGRRLWTQHLRVRTAAGTKRETLC